MSLLYVYMVIQEEFGKFTGYPTGHTDLLELWGQHGRIFLWSVQILRWRCNLIDFWPVYVMRFLNDIDLMLMILLQIEKAQDQCSDCGICRVAITSIVFVLLMPTDCLMEWLRLLMHVWAELVAERTSSIARNVVFSSNLIPCFFFDLKLYSLLQSMTLICFTFFECFSSTMNVESAWTWGTIGS